MELRFNGVGADDRNIKFPIQESLPSHSDCHRRDASCGPERSKRSDFFVQKLWERGNKGDQQVHSCSHGNSSQVQMQMWPLVSGVGRSAAQFQEDIEIIGDMPVCDGFWPHQKTRDHDA